MKTSNKILLSVFLLCLLILTAVHVALYAKYKNGEFVYKDMSAKHRTVIPGVIRYVSIHGLTNAYISPSDTLSFNAGVKLPSGFFYKVTGDTLFLQADSTGRLLDSAYPLDLRLPSGMYITANNCSIVIKGAADSIKAVSQIFNLTRTILNVDFEDAKPTTQHFNQLTIHAAEGSALSFAPLASVKKLDVSLVNSSMEEANASFDKFFLSADDSSTVNLSMRTLKKLNLTPKQ